MLLSENKNKNKEVKKMRILCIGEILWDMLPTGPKAGGAPMNVALHLKKFGMDAIFAGKVGNDKLGLDLIKFLESQGMDKSLMQIDNELPTSTVQVYLGDNHLVRFEIVDNVAWDRIELTEELKKAAKESDVIIYGTLASRHSFTRNTIINILDDNSNLKLIDVNLRPPYNKKDVVEDLLSRADIVKLNDDELKFISNWYDKRYNERDLIKWFLGKYNCKMICVTRGANGAIIFDGKKFYEHPGYKVQVVDTVGSGDAFLAGFLAMRLSGEQIDKSLDFACATGAFVASKEGATPEYGINEILKITNKKIYNNKHE
ncbi:MAG TPA: carbohydrate kinase [Bacteroidales bacterium]|nr:carbohydrate kinase [Bacteroidales bacterium]HQG53527.1 carbohydrate kinase [Bacteroidales bacterium]